MSSHKLFTLATDIQVYFCDPKSPWQRGSNENTNRLLNYLEFMIDFPIDRLIKSKFTKNCFLGITAAHRSGIFATSDILGSVAGGSDWVTLSYECLR